MGSRFDIPVYFSESQKQNVRVEDMPMQYAWNVFNKLKDEEGFEGSALQTALLKHLIPSVENLALILAEHGKALSLCPAGEANRIRQRFKRAGQLIGQKISTHTEGPWIEGKIAVRVKVNPHA